MAPPRTVHKCNKEQEITDLTHKVNKLNDAIYGNGDGQPGMKVNVALLAQQMGQVLGTITPMGKDMAAVKDFITNYKAVREAGQQDINKKNMRLNTIMNVIIGITAIAAVIISLRALRGGA